MLKKKINIWWSYNGGVPNFGDELNPFLIGLMTNHTINRIKKIKWFSFKRVNLAIGSIIQASKSNCNVWGSGIIEKNAIISGGKIFAVRGPRTRKRLLELGLDCPEIYGDPALLLPRYIKRNQDIKYKYGIIPHVVDYELFVEKDIKDTLVIDLRKDVITVLKNIWSCEKIISSSLHGLIVPHSYGIPAIWVKFSDKLYGDNVKFIDYFESVGIEPYDITLTDPDSYNTKFIDDLFSKYNNISSIKFNLNQIQDNLISSCPFL
ncbi:MAG: polysaccharide pyruvyl transferase family protein [Cyclobacteriaceae bacterium]|nr:polysaccharide pyruvyl transferase family protein [Cyclobacteriaceae bacterium]